MVRNELKLRGGARGPPGLAAELALLSSEMQSAFRDAYAAYEALGIRFAVVGALAAGAYGEPRGTKNIDFLVNDEAFQRNGPLISFAKPLPLQAYSVAIDPIPLPEHPKRWKILDAALENPRIDLSTGTQVRLL